MKLVMGAALIISTAAFLPGCSESQAAPNPDDFAYYVVEGENQIGTHSCTFFLRPIGQPEEEARKFEFYRYNISRPASFEFTVCKNSTDGQTVMLPDPTD